MHYVEPFLGSGAVLLARPGTAPWPLETANDKDGFVSNFWRAVTADAAVVAHYADYPCFENDLHARHAWLVGQKESLQARLEGDPDFYDAKIAGWWAWGMSLWIGSGFCSGKGPWEAVDGQLIPLNTPAQGVRRQLPHLSHGERGVRRQLPHLSTTGQGVQRQLASDGLLPWLTSLQERLRHVRVCCGDWQRVCTPAVLYAIVRGPIGVFLDPPYGHDQGRSTSLYRLDEDVTGAVRQWCLRHGGDRHLRIVLCGYAGEYAVLQDHGWRCWHWHPHGGYGGQGQGEGRENRVRETCWISPHCVLTLQLPLFGPKALEGIEIGGPNA